MSAFLTKIKVNRIFNLENFEIDIDSNEKKHLILTGRNGSGKTSLLRSMIDFFQSIKNQPTLPFYNIDRDKKIWQVALELRKQDGEKSFIADAENALISLEKQREGHFGKLELVFSDVYNIAEKVKENQFLLAFYEAKRQVRVDIPPNPEKPNLAPERDLKSLKTGEFVKFLVDLKIQEALARNEGKTEEATEIKTWFDNFNDILKALFEDKDVALHFNYKNYAFSIHKGDQHFGFKELSDGYSALIDIIADLILKMQETDNLTRGYEKEGIVLIDEIETHLHLKLQRIILPMLTKVFPNIQFIVTTHSPFILSSLKNAVAYDLEKKTRLEDLTEYSYEALAEGYFKVDTDSLFLSAKLERFKELSENGNRDIAEEAEYISLDKEFDSLDEAISSPAIKGQYLGIKLKNIKLG